MMNGRGLKGCFRHFGFLVLAILFFSPALANATIRVSFSLDRSSYQQGDLVLLTAVAKDGSGRVISSPEVAEVVIQDSRRRQVIEDDLVKGSNGVLSYQYRLAENALVGTWTATVKIQNRGEIKTAGKKFSVIKKIAPDPNTVDNDGDGFNEIQGDCNDANASIYLGAAEVCGDGIDQDCSGADLACPPDPNTVDNDGDGFNEIQGDCNDANASIYLGATEVCGDGIDQDCSGADLACPSDPNTVDNDGDGFNEIQGDCNDANASIYLGAAEVCGDGIDQDCSGADLACTSLPPTDGHYGSDCVGCHGTEATEVHGSLHYQWQGPALDMVNQPGTLQGKLTNSVNSYCINILGNWTGCSACHIGKGAKPEAVATVAQLANIDCLKCHSKGGVLPTRVDCLKCHAKAGGGDAVKRGDLALASGITADRNYDVHMATTGADLACQACHITQNHRIAGKGSDLRATDLDVKVECNTCHTSAPHSNSTINQHAARVACQTCHIPTYAKNAADTAASEATETFRSWRSSEAAAPPLHPASTKANNLLPRYRFWNGQSDNYLLGDVAQLDPVTGKYPTSRPIGSVQDGKLYPFKYKTAEQPMASGSNILIALDTSVFFATADADAATRKGLLNMGMSESSPWEWVQTDTFQGLNHQVSSKDQALQCAACHGSTTRMNLKGELGYQIKGTTSTTCTQCHGQKENKPFQTIHDIHVKDKRYDCSWCHTFSRPERGLRKP